MYDNKVMKVVENIPTDANLIGTKWVIAEKDYKKKKTRLAALSCQQVDGEDFIETYSPTVQEDSLRLIVAIASKFNWDLKQLDIKAAYLNADLEEKIYTKIPYGEKKFLILIYSGYLKKALYGLNQAERMWYNEISHYFSKYRF